MTTSSKTNNQNNWIKSKRKEFHAKYGSNLWLSSRPEPHYRGEPYTYTSCGEEVWSFITSVIKQADQLGYARGKEELAKEIWGMKIPLSKEKSAITLYSRQITYNHNRTLDDVLKVINQSLEGKQSKK